VGRERRNNSKTKNPAKDSLATLANNQQCGLPIPSQSPNHPQPPPGRSSLNLDRFDLEIETNELARVIYTSNTHKAYLAAPSMRRWLGSSSGSDSGGGKRVKRSPKQTSWSPCPVCDKQVPTNALTVHVSQCLDLAQQGHERAQRPEVSGEQPSTPDTKPSTARHPEPTPPKANNPSQPSAFGALMSTARYSAIVHLITCDSNSCCTWTQTAKRRLPTGDSSRGVLPPVQTTLKRLSINLAVQSTGPPASAAELMAWMHQNCAEREWTASQLSIPILKSCLQKAVRRGLARVAVGCAAELMVRDLTSFLRRFPVIALEDSVS
jgi:hypothetical protein